ncbi:MAG: YicC/YloC family endoribonuclease, partial [Ignavibacteria bacterium]|nr:YicC/YloC family endoribonuclease [Ignavibacteria bacterium]
MIRSMTGYGKVQQFYDSRRVVIEIKSLNSKQFDLSMRLPADLRLIEFELRNKLSETIQRGKVDFTITFEDQDQKRIGRIDKEVAAAGYKQLQELAWDLQFKMAEDVAAVLSKFPG